MSYRYRAGSCLHATICSDSNSSSPGFGRSLHCPCTGEDSNSELNIREKLTVVTSKVSGIIAYAVALAITVLVASLKEDLFVITQDPTWLILNTVGEIAVSTSLTFARISICCFLARFFTTDLKWKRTLYTIITLVIITYMIWLALYFTRCSPVRKLFYPNIPGHCKPWTRLSAVGNYQGCMYPKLRPQIVRTDQIKRFGHSVISYSLPCRRPF